MKKAFIGIISAFTGAGIGVGLTWIFAKKYYQKQLEARISELADMTADVIFKSAEDCADDLEMTEEEYSKLVDEAIAEKAASYSEIPMDIPEETHAVNTVDATDPIYIEDSEFGSDNNDKLYWTVYKDGIIADERDNIVKNPAHTIGDDILADLKDAGTDYIYIRNEALMVDVEIGFSVEEYADVVSKHPYGL